MPSFVSVVGVRLVLFGRFGILFLVVLLSPFQIAFLLRVALKEGGCCCCCLVVWSGHGVVVLLLRIH